LTGKDHFTEFCKHSGIGNSKFKELSACQEGQKPAPFSCAILTKAAIQKFKDQDI